MDEVEVEGPAGNPEAEVEVRPAGPKLSGHEEARTRHEWNVNRLARLRFDRDHLNDMIRVAVQEEDLSRRALAIYEKAESAQAADES